MRKNGDPILISFPHWQLVTRWEGATSTLAAAVAARWQGVMIQAGDDGEATHCPTVRLAIRSADDCAQKSVAPQHTVVGRKWRVRFEAGKGSTITIGGGLEPSCEHLAGALELALIHALAMRGAAVVHACCFSIWGQSVLALGPGRVGKSTLTAAALAAGGRVVSDDSVVVAVGHGKQTFATFFRRHLVFRDGVKEKLLRDFAKVLQLSPWVDGRRWILSRDHLGDFGLVQTPLNQVWLLAGRVEDDSTVIGRLSAAEVLAAAMQGGAPLFLSVHFPQEREATLPVLSLLAEQLPAFKVATGPDLLERPGVVLRGLLESTGYAAQAAREKSCD